MSKLFEHLCIRDITLKNRIVVAPMLSYAATDGLAGDWHVMHLGRFAAGGAGLVFMEATAIREDGKTSYRDVGIWDDVTAAPLARIADFVSSFGVAAGIQLNHSGRKRKNYLPWENPDDSPGYKDGELLGPSAISHPGGFPVPREASLAEITSLVEAYAIAARRARIAGFKVIELHGAHGYLLHQFLSPASNHRVDRYGGSLANRMRFFLEVAEAVRSEWPENLPFFARISAVDEMGWKIEDSVTLARALRKRGVDVIDCSSGGMGGNVLNAIAIPYGYQVPYAERIRSEAGVGTMAVGLIVHPDQAQEIIESGKADLIAIGREFLHNPNWPMDAAQKLGLAPGSPGVPDAYRFWLDKRASNNIEIEPSTWRPGRKRAS